MRVPSPGDRIYACVRQFTMNLRYAFNNCAFARVRVNAPIFMKTGSFTRIFPPG